MTPTRRTVLGTVGTGLALALAGCGGDGSGETPDGSTDSPDDTPTDTTGPGGTATPAGTATASPTETRAETATPTGTAQAQSAQAAYPDYDWGQLEGTDPQPVETITMAGFAFDPLVAAVEPGELEVVNEDGAGHTVTVPALEIDERLGGGERRTISVDSTGTFDYVCRFHPPGMVGRLVVSEG